MRIFTYNKKITCQIGFRDKKRIRWFTSSIDYVTELGNLGYGNSGMYWDLFSPFLIQKKL
jgi:hypothetical protein